MTILTAAGEIMLLVVHLISLAFLNQDMPEDKINQIGWVLLVLVGLYIIVNWVIVVIMTILNIRDNMKAKKKI